MGSSGSKEAAAPCAPAAIETSSMKATRLWNEKKAENDERERLRREKLDRMENPVERRMRDELEFERRRQAKGGKKLTMRSRRKSKSRNKSKKHH
jgi:hypothetical protein